MVAKQDLGSVLGEHAPQPAGVIEHPDLADTGQGDRPRPVTVSDPDRRRPALGVLVAQPKRRHSTGFLLEPREPNPLTSAFPGTRIRPGFKAFTAIGGGFFEHLLTHLAAPRQAGHDRLGWCRRYRR